MKRISKTIVLLILVSLLFQAVTPIFLSVLTAQESREHFERATLHAEHHSVIAPLLYKEKEESETREDGVCFELIALIDFSNQHIVLRQHHTTKITPLIFHNQIDVRPPLYNLNSAFLI